MVNSIVFGCLKKVGRRSKVPQTLSFKMHVPVPFEIKNLPDSVRMALKNIYNPINDDTKLKISDLWSYDKGDSHRTKISGKELKEIEMAKIRQGVIVVFDDNVSGGATLSDVCLQLMNLGAEHIIPITFGQMRKKTTTKDEDNATVYLNEPQKGFNFPEYNIAVE